MKCNIKDCYKCSKYETCETRYNYHAAPVLVGVMTIGFLALVVLAGCILFALG